MSGFELASLVITSIGTACWGVCFWWMRRISQRQDAMLKEQQQVMQRIEQLSEKEHELIREVHPNVEELKESVKDVADKVRPRTHRLKRGDDRVHGAPVRS